MALNSIEDEKNGLKLGAVDYITKPFSTAAAHVSIRIGVVTICLDNSSVPLNILVQADQNLYHAKQNGRNRVVCSELFSL